MARTELQGGRRENRLGGGCLCQDGGNAVNRGKAGEWVGVGGSMVWGTVKGARIWGE